MSRKKGRTRGSVAPLLGDESKIASRLFGQVNSPVLPPENESCLMYFSSEMVNIENPG